MNGRWWAIGLGRWSCGGADCQRECVWSPCGSRRAFARIARDVAREKAGRANISFLVRGKSICDAWGTRSAKTSFSFYGTRAGRRIYARVRDAGKW